MRKIVEAVNRFRVQCQGCDHYYQTALVGERQILLHAKVDPARIENARLPTPRCRLSYDYVLFEPCDHCCPEVFANCPESHEGPPGRPTRQRCG